MTKTLSEVLPAATPENGKPLFGQALKWSFVMTWGSSAVNAATMLLLAAMLGPEAFGVVTLAGIYVLFVQLFLDPGITQALIQRKDLQVVHLDSCFWAVAFLSVGLFALCIFSGQVWVSRGGSAEYAAVFSWLSLRIPLVGLIVVHQAKLRREMDVKLLAIRANIAVLIGAAIGISMALLGYGYWSLVGQQLSEAAVGLLLIWRLSDWRPRASFRWSAVRDVSRFSFGTFLSNMGVFAYMRGDAAVMGYLFGPVVVSFYRLAVRLTKICSDIGGIAINYAALPELARHQSNQKQLHSSTLLCIRIASTSTNSLLGILAAVSGILLPLMGHEWQSAHSPLLILCVMGAFQIVTIVATQLLQAVGRPYLNAALSWMWGCIAIVAVWLVGVSSADDKVFAVCTAFLVIAVVLHFPTYVHYLNKTAGVTAAELLLTMAPSVVAAVSAYLVVIGFVLPVAASLPLYLQLCIAGATALLVTLTVLLLTDLQLRRLLITAINKQITELG